MTAISAEVLAHPDIWRGDRLAEAPLPTLASGFPELDAELPGGGWPRGALTELLVDGHGLGEISLLLPALRFLRDSGGWSLAVAPPQPLHAPAWVAAGVDLARLMVVSPASERDALWAMEQALVSGAPKLVLGWAAHADARQLRRLQVAAVQGGMPALLFRPARAGQEASPAPLRLVLAAGGEGGLSVCIRKRRGPPMTTSLLLKLPRPAAWRAHGPALAGHPPATRRVAVPA
jgi:cell division inhibitor SulA/protein ImuA